MTTTTTSPARQRGGGRDFKNKWIIDACIEVVERDKDSGEPSSAVCKFCCTFGREDYLDPDKGKKRQRNANLHYFKRPWRLDKMKEHHKRNHPLRWQEYQRLSLNEKKLYFRENGCVLPDINTNNDNNNNDTTTNRIVRTPIPRQGVQVISIPPPIEQRTVFCDKAIVEAIVDEVLFASIDEEEENAALEGVDVGLINEPSSRIFELVEHNAAASAGIIEDIDMLGNDDEHDDIVGRDVYKAIIPNVYQYEYVMQIVASGRSITKTAEVMEGTESTRFNVSIKEISRYVRLSCGLAYQSIKRILSTVWCFSLSLDRVNEKVGTPYLDVRLRFVLNANMYTIHVIAIPMYEQHTGLNMYNTIKNILDALCIGWEKKMIGYTCDNSLETNNNAVVSPVDELSTSIQNVAHTGFYHTWYAAHQLNDAIQHVFDRTLFHDERFVRTMHLLTGHLRRQPTLIHTMKTTCPRFTTTKNWLSMEKVLNWLVRYCRLVQDHINKKKNPPYKPTREWWILLFVLQDLVALCQTFINELNNHKLLITQQKQVLERLRERLMQIGQVQHVGPRIGIAFDDTIVRYGDFSVSLHMMKSYVLNLGNLHIISLYEELEVDDDDNFYQLNKDIATILVSLVHTIYTLSPPRGSFRNRLIIEMPPCLPYSVATIGTFQFSKIVREQMNRLELTFEKHTYVDDLLKEYKDFETKYQCDTSFQMIVNNTKHLHLHTNNEQTATTTTTNLSFVESWKLFQPTYPKLVEFCGGLASVFPSNSITTSVVESSNQHDNFASTTTAGVVAWEKEDNRSSNLTDVSLEGILHAQQRSVLNQLEYYVDQHEI